MKENEERVEETKVEDVKKEQVTKAKKVAMSPEVEVRYQLLLAKKIRGGK